MVAGSRAFPSEPVFAWPVFDAYDHFILVLLAGFIILFCGIGNAL